MMEIMKLKKKHSAPTSDTVSEVINKRISTTDSSMQDMEQQLAEGKRKVEDLAKQLSSMRDKLDSKNRALDDKAKELKTEKEKLHDLEKENDRIQKDNHAQQIRIEKMRIIKPNATDQNILEDGEKKFKLYKELTRIRWDYGALDRETKGFVTDKKNYIKNFCYPKTMTSSEVSDHLWKEIQLSTGIKLEDDQDKENASSNPQN